MSARAPFVLVVSLQPLDATTALFFGHLLGHRAVTVRVTQYGGRKCVALLSRASAVIFVRGLFECADLARGARTLGIPTYYFLDDNFMVLREQGGRDAEFVGEYSLEAVRVALEPYAGVLLSSSALIKYFSDHALHEQLMLFPPVTAARVVPARAPRPGVHLAFFGGRHLHGIFDEAVLPAIRRLARQRPVTLIVVGLPAPLPVSEGLTILAEPYHPAYADGMARLADFGVDVLVHPSASGMANNAYKNPHALLSARQLGAVPVVSNVAPYTELAGEGVAICCDDSSESWYAALAQSMRPDQRRPIEERFSTFCATHFSGSVNRPVVDEVLRLHAPPNTRWMWTRRGVVRACLLLGRLRQGGARVMRRLRLSAGSSGP